MGWPPTSLNALEQQAKRTKQPNGGLSATFPSMKPVTHSNMAPLAITATPNKAMFKTAWINPVVSMSMSRRRCTSHASRSCLSDIDGGARHKLGRVSSMRMHTAEQAGENGAAAAAAGTTGEKVSGEHVSSGAGQNSACWQFFIYSLSD